MIQPMARMMMNMVKILLLISFVVYLFLMYHESALFPCFFTAARRKSMLDAIEREFEGTSTYFPLSDSDFEETLNHPWCNKSC